MNTAEKIYTDMQSAPETVHVDYLCFTFKLKDLRHCFYALGDKSPENKFTASRKSLLKRCSTSPKFPEPPQACAVKVQSVEDMNAFNSTFAMLWQNYLERCLKVFTEQVLGLSLSAPRGLGFQFYTDSMKLTSPNGEDFCGFVGIGGNEDTVHFQINGTGCKHMVARRPLWAVHDWLHNVLGVTKLARVDLAYDDYHGLFDCDYALKAAYEGAFRTSDRGRSPKLAPLNEFTFDSKTGEQIFSKEQLSVGSRTSQVYWRIYNKALEQNLAGTGLTWYRSEVELKKWDIDVLLDPAGAFAGINEYGASISTSKPFNTKPKPTKKVALDLLSSAYWMRRQYGKILSSLVEFHDGDLETVVSSLIRDGNKFTFPSTYNKLVTEILET